MPVVNSTQERIDSILDDTPATFEVANNPSADSHYGEWRALHDIGAMQTLFYADIIDIEAAAQGIDPNLVKAIMYVENAHGGIYGYAAENIGIANSIYPMNINPEIWGDLIPSGDFSDPTINIRAGVTLIKRIIDRLDNPSVEQIATLYVGTGFLEVHDYGARVKMVMDNQLWEDPLNYPVGYTPVSAADHFGVTGAITDIWSAIRGFDGVLEAANPGETFIGGLAEYIKLSGGFNEAILNIFGLSLIADPEVTAAPTSTTDYFSIGNAFDNPGQSPNDILREEFRDGILLNGGNWNLSSFSNVVNGNGITNVAQSALLSDWWRPGAGELSTYDFAGFMGGTSSAVWGDVRNSFFDTSLQFDAGQFSVPGGFNNYQWGALDFLNIDPLVLDLDGDGIELQNYQSANVLFNMCAANDNATRLSQAA